jgi:hypothetical protein
VGKVHLRVPGADVVELNLVLLRKQRRQARQRCGQSGVPLKDRQSFLGLPGGQLCKPSVLIRKPALTNYGLDADLSFQMVRLVEGGVRHLRFGVDPSTS